MPICRHDFTPPPCPSIAIAMNKDELTSVTPQHFTGGREGGIMLMSDWQQRC